MQLVARAGGILTETKVWSLLGPPNASLLDALVHSIQTKYKVLISLGFVGLLAGLGRATFYLPDNPIPITLQTVGVLLTGGVLGWRWGLFAILLWYILGAAGIPVFKDGGNGWSYVSATATGGYLIGFVAATPLVGFLAQRGWHRGRVLWPMLIATLVIYIPGLLWLYAFDFEWSRGHIFSVGMYPFIPGDLVKLILGALVIGLGWKIADSRSELERKSG